MTPLRARMPPVDLEVLSIAKPAEWMRLAVIANSPPCPLSVVLQPLGACLRWGLSDPGEGAAGLASCRSAAGDAAGHASDGGPADEGFGDSWVAFVVAGQPAAGGEPRQGAFHDPAARMHSEAALVGGLTDDLQGGAQDVAGPVDQPSGEALVGEDVPNRGEHVGAEQGTLGAVAVLPARGEYGHGDQ